MTAAPSPDRFDLLDLYDAPVSAGADAPHADDTGPAEIVRPLDLDDRPEPYQAPADAAPADAPAPAAPAPTGDAGELQRAAWTPPASARPARTNAMGRAARVDPAIAAARAAAAEARDRLGGMIRIALAGGSDGEYRHGAIVAWRPSGDVAWDVVAAAAAAAGVAPPARRSDRAIASEAVRYVADRGLRVETVKRGARWRVYRPTTVVAVGASIGAAYLVAELQGDTLQLEGPADLAEIVRTAFSRARSEAMLGTSDVSAWLASILDAWAAVPTVYGRYIAAPVVDRWRALAAALADAGLPVPRQPAAVASPDHVRDEIQAGLLSEVSARLAFIRERRARALSDGASDLGVKGAATAIADLDDLRAKLSTYELLTGPLPEARAEIDALASSLAPILDATTQRGVVIEMD